MLLNCAHGKNFYAAVIEISDEAADLQFLSGMLSEVAVAYPLDHPRYEVSLC